MHEGGLFYHLVCWLQYNVPDLSTRRVDQQRVQEQERKVLQQDQTIHEYSKRTAALEALFRQHLPPSRAADDYYQ